MPTRSTKLPFGNKPISDRDIRHMEGQYIPIWLLSRDGFPTATDTDGIRGDVSYKSDGEVLAINFGGYWRFLKVSSLLNGLSLAVASKTAAYTATVHDDVLLCNGTFTVSLPTAAGITGKVLYIKNTGSGTITIDGYLSETVGGGATASVAAGNTTKIISDGTNWITL